METNLEKKSKSEKKFILEHLVAGWHLIRRKRIRRLRNMEGNEDNQNITNPFQVLMNSMIKWNVMTTINDTRRYMDTCILFILKCTQTKLISCKLFTLYVPDIPSSGRTPYYLLVFLCIYSLS